jgi:EAL domain-containing protein (putative c-di-GMP-specific phosphodiesterase class I)
MTELSTRSETPRVCITDGRQHIREFLRDALKELDCIAYECVQASELSVALDARLPDLVILGLMGGKVSAGDMLKALAAKNFDGMVLPFAARNSSALATVQELAETLGLAMLPPLLMPLSKERVCDSITALLPEASSGPPVNMGEGVRASWLELWYQPKIDARALVMRGAEALLRVRHPLLGIVPTTYFIADDSDPRFRPVWETVINRAIDDWHYFLFEHGPFELAINLPINFLRDPDSISYLRQKLPHHTAFEGLIIESNGTDIVRNLELAKDVARQLRFHKIAISIDGLGAEWLSLAGLREFPFVEVKVDRKFVIGCADDTSKQTACRQILDLANGYGARTVAEGVENWADFLAVREMGFDLVQGLMFAKPMSAEKFARACWVTPQPRIAPARFLPVGSWASPPCIQPPAQEESLL